MQRVQLLDHARELAQLDGCLASLGDVHRHVVTLRVLDEFSGDEAARALAQRVPSGMPPSVPGGPPITTGTRRRRNASATS